MQGESRARLSATPVPDDPPAVPSQHARRLRWLLAAVAFAVFVADQATKAWALAALTDQPPRPVLGSALQLWLIRNPGAAFSLGTGSTWLLTLLAVVVMAMIIRSSRRLGSLGWTWAFALVLGGALGNLTDRLTREPGFGRGHVVDFIDYNGWFIGNVADIAIVSAAALIGLLAVRGIGLDGRRAGERPGIPDALGSESEPTQPHD